MFKSNRFCCVISIVKFYSKIYTIKNFFSRIYNSSHKAYSQFFNFIYIILINDTFINSNSVYVGCIFKVSNKIINIILII